MLKSCKSPRIPKGKNNRCVLPYDKLVYPNRVERCRIDDFIIHHGLVINTTTIFIKLLLLTMKKPINDILMWLTINRGLIKNRLKRDDKELTKKNVNDKDKIGIGLYNQFYHIVDKYLSKIKTSSKIKDIFIDLIDELNKFRRDKFDQMKKVKNNPSLLKPHIKPHKKQSPKKRGKKQVHFSEDTKEKSTEKKRSNRNPFLVEILEGIFDELKGGETVNDAFEMVIGDAEYEYDNYKEDGIKDKVKQYEEAFKEITNIFVALKRKYGKDIDQMNASKVKEELGKLID